MKSTEFLYCKELDTKIDTSLICIHRTGIYSYEMAILTKDREQQEIAGLNQADCYHWFLSVSGVRTVFTACELSLAQEVPVPVK